MNEPDSTGPVGHDGSPETSNCCPCGKEAEGVLERHLGNFCSGCASRVEVDIQVAQMRLGWVPSPELATAIARDSDRHLSAKRLGALQRARAIQAWAEQAAARLSDPEIPQGQVGVSIPALNALYARTRGGRSFEFEARMEMIAVVGAASDEVAAGKAIGSECETAARNWEARWPEYAGRLDPKRLAPAVRNWGRKAGRPGKWALLADVIDQAQLPGQQVTDPDSLRQDWERWTARGTGKAIRAKLGRERRKRRPKS